MRIGKRKPRPARLEGASRRTSFRLPAKMLESYQAQALEDGYGVKERSLWLTEAIAQLLDRGGWAEMYIADAVGGEDSKEYMYIDSETGRALANAEHTLAELTGDKKGLQSSVIRMAITARLLDLPPIKIPTVGKVEPRFRPSESLR